MLLRSRQTAKRLSKRRVRRYEDLMTFDPIRIHFLQLDKASEGFARARLAWLGLLQRSFDADEESQQHVELLARHCMLLETLIHRLRSADEQKLACATKVGTASATSVNNRRLESLHEWAMEQANERMRPVVGNSIQRHQAWTSVSVDLIIFH